MQQQRRCDFDLLERPRKKKLLQAANTLDSHGFLSRPAWANLVAGQRPAPPQGRDVGEWSHGWQYHASSASEHHFRRGVVLPSSDRAGKAHLRSHAGAFAGAVFNGAPTAPEYQVPAALFRTLVKERLRLPLDVTEARCEGCNKALDAKGWHRSACTLTCFDGREKKVYTDRPAENEVGPSRIGVGKSLPRSRRACSYERVVARP